MNFLKSLSMRARARGEASAHTAISSSIIPFLLSRDHPTRSLLRHRKARTWPIRIEGPRSPCDVRNQAAPNRVTAGSGVTIENSRFSIRQSPLTKTVSILIASRNIANLLLQNLLTLSLQRDTGRALLPRFPRISRLRPAQTLLAAVLLLALALCAFCTGCHPHSSSYSSLATDPTLEYYSYDFVPRHRDPDETNVVWVTVVELRPKDFTQTGTNEPGIRIPCNTPDEVLNAVAPYHWKLVTQSGDHYTVARPAQPGYKFSVLLEDANKEPTQ